MNEIRHALRRLRATPVVTLSAIACLAIGVWMTCIVSAVGGGFFRPRLNVPHPEELVYIDEVGLFATKQDPFGLTFGRTTSLAVIDSLAARKVFAAIGSYAGPFAGMISGDRRARQTVIMSSSMMDVLALPTTLGRRFIPADDSVPSAMISTEVWRTMFGSDPAVIGRQLRLSRLRTPIRIVGVVAQGFTFPRSGARVSIYLSEGNGAMGSGPARVALARLHAGQRAGDVRPIVKQIALRNVASDREEMIRAWRAEYTMRRAPELAMQPVDVRVARYYNEPPIRGIIQFVTLVLGCGIAVVLIAASNVTNLLLIRGAARRQEIAVRMALGASRIAVVRGLVIEAALVAMTGSVLGFTIAYWQWQFIDASFDGRDWFGQIDAATVPIALAAGFVLTLLVGVWPGIRATSMNLEQVLRDTRRAGINASPLDNLLGRLVAASTAATVMLLVCATLLGLSAREWVTDKVGPERKALTSLLTLDESRSRAERVELARQALGRVRALPGVRFAVLGPTPTGGEPRNLHATPDASGGRRMTATDMLDVSDGYFDAMGIRLLHGRGFTRVETRDSTNAVVISRGVATILFGTEIPIGRSFRYWADADSIMIDATVVGVAENVPTVGKLQLYRPFGRMAPAHTPILIGTQSETAMTRPINRILRGILGVLSSDVETLGARPNDAYTIIRYMLMGFVMFAGIGMILAAIGTYGIVAYSVVRRTHEIGVRIALGADRSRVVWMILEQGLKTTLIGAAFGLVLSFGATRLLGALVEEMRLNFPLAMSGVVVLVIAVSGIACLIPGYRAGRLNPVDALRAE